MFILFCSIFKDLVALSDFIILSLTRISVNTFLKYFFIFFRVFSSTLAATRFILSQYVILEKTYIVINLIYSLYSLIYSLILLNKYIDTLGEV